MRQVLALHARAGGSNPGITNRRDLIEAGVPIRAHGLSSEQKRLRRERVRAALRAHEAANVAGEDLAGIKGHYKFWFNWQQRRARSLQGPVDRGAYRHRCDDLWRRWTSGDALSDIECASDDKTKADENYADKVGDLLWGTSDRHWPVLPQRLVAVADKEVPTGRERTGGLTDRLAPVRQRFLEEHVFGPADSKAEALRGGYLSAQASCSLQEQSFTSTAASACSSHTALD